MVKWWNKLVEISSSQNGKMVKRLYSPSSSLSFTPPSDNGGQACILTTLAIASALSASVVSGQCRDYFLIVPQAATTHLDAITPRWFWSVYFFFTLLPPPLTPGGGVVHLFNVLVLAIILCSFTDNLLYYLCDTVTYTTLTTAVWSLHDRIIKVYFWNPVEFVRGLHTNLGLKCECVTISLIYD